MGATFSMATSGETVYLRQPSNISYTKTKNLKRLYFWSTTSVYDTGLDREEVTIEGTETGWTYCYLDGSGDHINVGNDSSLSITPDVSIAVWVMPLDTGSGYIWAKRDNADGEYSMFLNTNNTVSIMSNAGGTILTTTEQLPVSTWSHIVGTWDNTTGKIYINGGLVKSGTITQMTASASDRGLIGARWTTYPTVTLDKKMFISDLRIYDDDLRANEVQALYRGDDLLTGTQADLVAHWAFNDGIGQTVSDRFGVSDGTFTGNTKWMGPLNDIKRIEWMIDNGEEVTITGLDNTHYNDTYYIKSFDWHEEGGMQNIYPWKITLEKA